MQNAKSKQRKVEKWLLNAKNNVTQSERVQKELARIKVIHRLTEKLIVRRKDLENQVAQE